MKKIMFYFFILSIIFVSSCDSDMVNNSEMADNLRTETGQELVNEDDSNIVSNSEIVDNLRTETDPEAINESEKLENNNADLEKNASYLSINVTVFNDGSSDVFVDESNIDVGMSILKYYYDIQSGEIRLLSGDIDYNAAYSLSAYCKYDNTIYFSSFFPFEEGGRFGGDQLCSLNLDTGEKKVLTDNLHAINHIIPLEDIVVLSARPFGQHWISVVFYDKKTEKTEIQEIALEFFDDFSVGFLSYNIDTNQMIAAGFSLEERDMKTMDFNRERTPTRIAPDFYVYSLFEEDGEPKLIYKTDDIFLTKGALDNNGNLLFTVTDTWFGPAFHTYLYDIENEIYQTKENISSILYVSSYTYLSFNGDTSEVFFIGAGLGDDEDIYPHGIYKFCFDKNELTHIFSVENGYINNFMLLR